MKRELVLKKEQLTELSTEELASIVGGTVPFTFLCGPATLNTLLC